MQSHWSTLSEFPIRVWLRGLGCRDFDWETWAPLADHGSRAKTQLREAAAAAETVLGLRLNGSRFLTIGFLVQLAQVELSRGIHEHGWIEIETVCDNLSDSLQM